jgi:bifunctional non-homologous end joining protein LigD
MTRKSTRKRKASRKAKRKTKRKTRRPAALQLMHKSPVLRQPKKTTAQARHALLPGFVEPCLATLVDKAPDNPRWIHEVKFDGYRIQARLEHGHVKLMTRKGLDWTERFPTVAEVVGKLRADTALMDGELVSEDTDGISRFSLLQQDLKAGRHDRMVLYVFDLLHCDGIDLKPLPLSERKAALARLLARVRGAVRLSESLTERGPVLLKQACKMGLEGIISKLADAPYHSGRGHDWLKAKCSNRQEFVVAGFAPSTADAHAIGALVLGVYEHGNLTYSGRVGTGFTHDTARALYRTLKSRERKTSPFKPAPTEERGRRGPVWVEPTMVVEVDFHGWTHGDRVRQGSFQGVREDKPAKQVVRESA